MTDPGVHDGRNAQTLTRTEQEALLLASAGHPRDHLLFSMALGTGLRLGEIVGLNVGDVFLPDALVAKLRAFWAWKSGRIESLAPVAPIFCNCHGTRISKRRVQIVFKEWQTAAGFDRSYCFHCLCQSAVTAVYRSSRDLFLAQRFARHVSPLTTIVYTHASDDDLRDGVRNPAC